MEFNRDLAAACLCLLTLSGIAQEKGRSTGETAQTTSGSITTQQDPVLMTVDGKPVTRGEFEAVRFRVYPMTWLTKALQSDCPEPGGLPAVEHLTRLRAPAELGR